MFDKQYRFTGKHAEMVNKLTGVFEESTKTKTFNHNYDVYMNAPIIGFLYNRKGEKSTLSEIADQNIFAEQMINISEEMKYIFRLILVLDVKHEPDLEKRLDKAYRNLGNDLEDIQLFDEYVLGGVEVLYEKLIGDAVTTDDYVKRLFDFIEEFDERFNSEVTNNDILAICQTVSNSI